MKKRRALLLTLLALLLVVGIPTGLLVREYRQEQVNRDLIAAIKANDTDRALAALRVGAEGNAHDHTNDKPLSFVERITHDLAQFFHRHSLPSLDNHPSALNLLIGNRVVYESQSVGQNKVIAVPVTKPRKENTVLLRALLEHGADPNRPNQAGDPPLILITCFGYQDSLRILLQHGADVNIKDSDGDTALHFAAYEDAKDVPMLRLLLDNGADRNACDKDSKTPLMFAAQFGSVATAQILLNHQVRVNCKNVYGETALDLTRFLDETDMAWILRKAGAKTSQELDAQAATPPKH